MQAPLHPSGRFSKNEKVILVRQERERSQGPLYDPRFEHDNCGIGAVVDIKGHKSHQTVDNALKIVEKL